MKMIINVPDWIVNAIENGEDVDFCNIGDAMYDAICDGTEYRETDYND